MRKKSLIVLIDCRNAYGRTQLASIVAKVSVVVGGYNIRNGVASGQRRNRVTPGGYQQGMPGSIS